jgi:signal transduction histidine kinase
VRSFTFRITCRFAALVTATTAAVLAIGGVLLDRQIENGIELLHDVEAAELTALIGPDPNLPPATLSERIKRDADSDAALFVIQVANAKGELVFRSDNLGESVLPAETAPHKHWTAAVPNLGDVRLSVYPTGPWRITIGSLLFPSQRMLNNYVRICVPLLAGVVLISIGLGYAFSRSTLRPIKAIEATANRINADNLNERIPTPSGRDELASLTRLLNQMFDRLQRSFEQVNRFAADASHEMKTPLALIRLQVEKLVHRAGNDAETSASLADVLEEISRLHRVIDRLLFLAKAESGALSPTMKTVDMPGFIAGFVEDAEVLAEDRGVRFVVNRNDRGEFTAEPELLRQLLLNLVANAVAASPQGSTIQLDSIAAGREWWLIVTDEGPGIPEADLAHISTRYFQVPQNPGALTREGHGLGLAICRSIAEIHRGTMLVENRKDRSGLRVTVQLGVAAK